MKIEDDNPRNPDMSPEAIGSRLQMVDELLTLCLSLKSAGDAHRAKQVAEATASALTAAAEIPAR